MMKQLSFRLTCTLMLTGALMFAAPSAFADRPWQNAPSPASIISDTPISGAIQGSLTTNSSGKIFLLNTQGALMSVGSDGKVSPVTDSLPALALLTSEQDTLWGITNAPVPELLQISDGGEILQHFPLKTLLDVKSHLSALQVHAGHAFIADEGAPALSVLDLKTGIGHRFLGYDPSVTGRRPFIRAGAPILGPDHLPKTGGNVQMLVLDSKGQWLFYQPPAGPLYRIDTSLLTDPDFSPVEQLDGIVEWRDTPSLGGLVLSSDNHFFMLDVANEALLSFGSDRIPLKLLTDPRFAGSVGITIADAKTLVAAANESDGMHILRIALP
ncbi:NHL repeat-containing protein [Gluconobacter wancherniae]|uniref:hypothetical protein n=1 Tax=Gluconobacter wancherniae TaxID=1307955 RepID=UPI001B8B3963|nr:hypothetical protein [Gluconobacter wancherniae]MBS1087817.1 hypothetical protein [Gluconobacter wancherniae]